MLYLVWLPADPSSVAKLVPEGLTPAADRACYMNQYVVDDAEQTSNAASADSFGAYSLTYLGANLDGLTTEDGVPGRWWTNYYNSSESMNRYAAERGVPTGTGRTTLRLEGESLVATTESEGVPIIRTTARADIASTQRATGQLRYITDVDGEFVSGRYPFVADLATSFEVQSLEFLEPSHPTYQLRPTEPLQVTFGFYSPAMTFCYPGGEGPLHSKHGS